MQRTILGIVVVLSLSVLAPTAILAHQPFFEDTDISSDHPWQIRDPSISTAIYATLSSAVDVDYFAFEGLENEVILLELTIPQVEGQKDFAPTMFLMGPGLPKNKVPAGVVLPERLRCIGA